MSKKIKYLIFGWAAVLLLMGSLLNGVAADGGDGPVIVTVNQSCWMMTNGQNAWRSVAVGHRLGEGDVIEVKRGNAIEVSFDEQGKNVLWIEGDARLRVTGGELVRVELDRGKLYAVLDNLAMAGVEQFQVATPVAVSSVRGTYFKVQTDGASSQTALYKGSVALAAKDVQGRIRAAGVVLEPAESSEVSGIAREPEAETVMSRKDFDEINQILPKLRRKREPLDYQDALASQTHRTRARSNADFASESAPSGTSVVY